MKAYLLAIFVVFIATCGAHPTFHHPHHHGHFPTQNIGVPQHSVECMPGAIGLFAHPYDCTKYVNCGGGHTYIFNCAPSTVFDDLSKLCSWPQNVNCGTRAFNGMSNQNANTHGFPPSANSNWNTNSYGHSIANNAGTYPQINAHPVNSEGNLASRFDVPSSPNNVPNQSQFSQHSVQISQHSSNGNTETFVNGKPIKNEGNPESRIDVTSSEKNVPNQPQGSGWIFQQQSTSNNGVNNVNSVTYKWGDGMVGAIPKPPNTELLPPLEDNSVNTKLPSNNRMGRVDEPSDVNDRPASLDTRLSSESGTESSDLHTTEANTIKPTAAEAHPSEAPEKTPNLSLLTSKIGDEYKKYFVNSPSSTPKPIENTVNENLPVNNNIDASEQVMLRDDPNQSHLGDKSPQYFEDTTPIYLKYSKDQEPVMPIYDQPITLTVSQRPFQMPQSYNRKYYQSFIKSLNDKDETDGMLISDSMKKLLLPYISAKKQKVQNTESSDTDKTTPSQENAFVTTEIAVDKTTKATHTRFDGAPVTPTTEQINVVAPVANIPTIGNTQTQNTDQHPTHFQPDPTVHQNQVNVPPSQRPSIGNVQHTTRLPPRNDSRIHFPGPTSQSRRVVGYYHQTQTNRGLTPQLSEMRPVHHQSN